MKNYVIAGLLLATIGGSLPEADAADLRASVRPIRLDSAVYGNLATQKVCNATAAIASQCDGRLQCIVPVTNGLCGDPEFLTVKQVRVDYRCGRRPRSVLAPEYGSVAIECQ